jgi:hypothetical protein
MGNAIRKLQYYVHDNSISVSDTGNHGSTNYIQQWLIFYDNTFKDDKQESNFSNM